MFEYFQCEIVNAIIFLQETHSSEDSFNKLWDDFKGDGFFCKVQQVPAV